MKDDRAHRLLRLVALMHAGDGCDAPTLTDRLGVSRRTFFRDLSTLQKAGVRYQYDNKAKTYTLESRLVRPLNLTVGEALAVVLLTYRFLPQAMLPDFQAARRAAAKIEALLPVAMKEHCRTLLDGLDVRYPAMVDGHRLGGTFEQLHQAAAQQQKVWIQYDSFFEREQIELILRPYRVAFLGRGWYAVGYSELHQEVRTFKLDRIERIRILDTHFPLDRDFNLDTHFGQAWLMIPEGKTHRVRIRFSATVAGNVEEVIWHPTQRIRHQTDGSIVFEAEVDGIREISWWILGYADHAHVLAPAPLRKLVAARLQAAADQYAQNGVRNSS